MRVIFLAHPNGWGGAEQARMREAAVRCGARARK